jgi:hypothetical protein
MVLGAMVGFYLVFGVFVVAMVVLTVLTVRFIFRRNRR